MIQITVKLKAVGPRGYDRKTLQRKMEMENPTDQKVRDFVHSELPKWTHDFMEIIWKKI